MNARQRLYDAVKKARDEGEAWVTYQGERLRLRPFADEDTEYRPASAARPDGCVHEVPGPFGWSPHYVAFIKARVPGGIALADVWWHEDRLHCDYPPVGGGKRRRFRRGNDDIVLAIVAERHPRVGTDATAPA